MHIGSVPYLNAAPLTHFLDAPCEYLPPSVLAKKLHSGALDAALVSVTEVLWDDRYDVLDGYGIVSHGPVYSVFLAHKDPLHALPSVACDVASCTSINLLRVLLDEQNSSPSLTSLTDYSTAADHRNILLIGNPAIEFQKLQQRPSHPEGHQIWDLGEAWNTLTGLPFVYAVWALRRGPNQEETRRALRLAAETGLARIPQIASLRTEFDAEFRSEYLGGHIQYRIGLEERQGLEEFIRRLGRLSGARLNAPRFV